MRLVFALMLTVISTHVSAAVYQFSGTNITIPTRGPADASFVYVTDIVEPVVKISVRINNLSHAYLDDTKLVLSNPNGYSVLLWDKFACKPNGTTILFADDALTEFSRKCYGSLSLNAYSGTHKPGISQTTRQFTIPIAPVGPHSSTLAEIIPNSPNGRWILWTEDFVSSDGGIIGSWDLIIETQE